MWLAPNVGNAGSHHGLRKRFGVRRILYSRFVHGLAEIMNKRRYIVDNPTGNLTKQVYIVNNPIEKSTMQRYIVDNPPGGMTMQRYIVVNPTGGMTMQRYIVNNPSSGLTMQGRFIMDSIEDLGFCARRILSYNSVK